MPGFAELARQYFQEAAHDLHLARSRSTTTSEIPRPKTIAETSSLPKSHSVDSSTSTASSSPGEKRLSTSSNQETLADANGGEKGVIDLEAQGEVDDETPKNPGPEDHFLVTLKGREHLNPHTWGEGYRWYVAIYFLFANSIQGLIFWRYDDLIRYRFLTGFAGLLVLNASKSFDAHSLCLNNHDDSEITRLTNYCPCHSAAFASSAPSNLIPDIIAHYNVSEEIGILLISIFVAGYVVGPLVGFSRLTGTVSFSITYSLVISLRSYGDL